MDGYPAFDGVIHAAVPERPAPMDTYIGVAECAKLLGTSESWVRRHVCGLPSVKVGRLVRFDTALLLRQFQCKQSSGNRLKPERGVKMRLRRYQRGYVYKAGRRIKVWYGMWREDIQKPDGTIVRRQRNIRLGALNELPTRSAA